MARPGKPESEYRRAFDSLITDGKHHSTITANQLQAIVGGRYSRAADHIEAIRAEYLAAEAAQQTTHEQPAWYRERFADPLFQTVEDSVNRLWNEIGNEIAGRQTQAEQQFNHKMEELTLRRAQDLEQINRLEDDNEKKDLVLEEMKNSIAQMQIDIAQLNGKNEELEKTKSESQAEIKQSWEKISSLNTQLGKLQGELNYIKDSKIGAGEVRTLKSPK